VRNHSCAKSTKWQVSLPPQEGELGKVVGPRIEQTFCKAKRMTSRKRKPLRKKRKNQTYDQSGSLEEKRTKTEEDAAQIRKGRPGEKTSKWGTRGRKFEKTLTQKRTKSMFGRKKKRHSNRMPLRGALRFPPGSINGVRPKEGRMGRTSQKKDRIVTRTPKDKSSQRGKKPPSAGKKAEVRLMVGGVRTRERKGGGNNGDSFGSLAWKRETQAKSRGGSRKYNQRRTQNNGEIQRN